MNKLLIVLFFVLLLSSVVVAEQLKSWPAPVNNVKSVMRDVSKNALEAHRLDLADTASIFRAPQEPPAVSYDRLSIAQRNPLQRAVLDVKKSAYARIQRVDTFMVRRVSAVNAVVKPRVVYGNWRAPKTLHTTVPVSSSREKRVYSYTARI